jgi:site-specific recombinase XerD
MLQRMQVRAVNLGHGHQAFEGAVQGRSSPEESKVGVPRSVGGRRATSVNKSKKRDKIFELSEEELQRQKKKLAESALEKSTLAQYNSQVDKFLRFCRIRKLQSLPLTHKVVEDYLTVLILDETYANALGAMSALQWHQKRFLSYPYFPSGVVDDLLLKAKKLMAENARPLRDPLHMTLIKEFCEQAAGSDDLQMLMTAAVVTVGVRGLLRGGELMRLQYRMLSFDAAGTLKIDLGKRKRAGERAPVIYIDPVRGSRACPVGCLRRYILKVQTIRETYSDDLVFQTAQEAPLSYDILAQMVQRIMKDTGG